MRSINHYPHLPSNATTCEDFAHIVRVRKVEDSLNWQMMNGVNALQAMEKRGQPICGWTGSSRTAQTQVITLPFAWVGNSTHFELIARVRFAEFTTPISGTLSGGYVLFELGDGTTWEYLVGVFANIADFSLINGSLPSPLTIPPINQRLEVGDGLHTLILNYPTANFTSNPPANVTDARYLRITALNINLVGIYNYSFPAVADPATGTNRSVLGCLNASINFFVQ